MDIIDILLGRGQSGEKLAYTETKAFTYDGNYEGKEFTNIDTSSYAVRVGDAIDPKTITKISGIMGGQMQEMSASDLTIIDASYGYRIVANGMTLMVIVTSDTFVVPVGTYVAHADIGYVTRVEYETIHPIDPKYIPGAVLPVVELTTEVSVANKNGTVLTADETAEVARVLSEYDYAIVKFIWGGLPVLAVCMKTETESTHCLVGYFFAYVFSLIIFGGAGLAFLEPLTTPS